MGFGASEDGEAQYNKIKETVMGEVKKAMNPEFINRLDDIIVFHQLGKGEMAEILELMLAKENEKLFSQGLIVEYTKRAKDFLLEKGFDSKFGARPLLRIIQKYMDNALAEEILSNRFSRREGDPLSGITADISPDLENIEFTLNPAPSPAAKEVEDI